MGSKHKALFALAVFMIGMLGASDAEAGLFFRGPVFGRIRARIAERRERRLERREQRFERREPAARSPQAASKGKSGKGKPPANAANPAVPPNAGDPGAGAPGGGQNQIAANQRLAPVAPQDVCNVRLVRCAEQENADTKEKTPFCQVRSTPVGSPEEVLRVLKNGTLVVMRDDGLTATTPEMVRFLGAEYEAIAAQQTQAGGGVNPLITAFRAKNQALLSAAPQACVGGLNNFGSLAFNQTPGYTPNYNQPINPGGIPLAPSDGGVPPVMPITPPVNPQPNPGAALPQQDRGGDDAFDPAGLGTVQLRRPTNRDLASRPAEAHSGGPTTTAPAAKKRPVVEGLAQRTPTKPTSAGVPALFGSPFQTRAVIQ